jgi:hypothetical protein
MSANPDGSMFYARFITPTRTGCTLLPTKKSQILSHDYKERFNVRHEQRNWESSFFKFEPVSVALNPETRNMTQGGGCAVRSKNDLPVD